MTVSFDIIKEKIILGGAMSVTVQDCLRLPSFHSARVIAGKNGLGRIVSSVSVIEIPAKSVEAISVFNPNELLVTSFYSIKDDPTRQCEEMRNLYDAGGVALVLFYVGDVIPQVSDELLQTADVMNIPLILIEDEAEYSVSYSDVIKDVMGAVFYDQASTDSFSDTVENRLKQIPYNKRSMETLLNVIAETYNCNLVLYNKNGLYFTSIYKPSFGQFGPEFFFSAFADGSTDLFCKSIMLQDKSFYLYRKEFPHAGNTWLTLYASSNENSISEHKLDEICACTNFFSTLWGYTLDMQNYNTVITLILKSSRVIGEKFLEASGVPFSKLSTILVVESEKDNLTDILRQIEGILKESERFYVKDIIDDRLVILSSIMVSQKDDGIIATEIEKCINEYEGALFFLESSKNLTSMRKIYSDFCANSAAMSKIFIHRKFRDMYDVIFSQEITNLAINRGNRNDQIKSIIEALKDDSDNLMETLAVYLIDCDSQLSTTAATLFLHRNTVTYRLNKIKQITNTDFTLMPATYDFYLAAALWRLNKNS